MAILSNLFCNINKITIVESQKNWYNQTIIRKKEVTMSKKNGFFGFAMGILMGVVGGTIAGI